MRVFALLALAAFGCVSPKPPTTPAPTGYVLWQAFADLDGDGAAESITLSSFDVVPRARDRHEQSWINVPFTATGCEHHCQALLRIGTAFHEVALQANDGRGAVGIELIDIAAGDGHREILLRQQDGDDEISTSSITIATFDRGHVAEHELWGLTWPGNQSAIEIDGHGMIEVRFIACGQTTTVRYRRTRTNLLKIGEDTQKDASVECSG